MLLPPRVAETRKCVPYFLMMLSVILCRLGRLPSCLILWMKSGSKGTATPLSSCLSAARLFTFHRPNSLWSEQPFKYEGQCGTKTGRESNQHIPPGLPTCGAQASLCQFGLALLQLPLATTTPSPYVDSGSLPNFYSALSQYRYGLCVVFHCAGTPRASMGSQVLNQSKHTVVLYEALKIQIPTSSISA